MKLDEIPIQFTYNLFVPIHLKPESFLAMIRMNT